MTIESMQEHIEQKAKSCIKRINIDIQEFAEMNAELYVSTEVGLENWDETKESMKNVYIEEFINLVKKNI